MSGRGTKGLSKRARDFEEGIKMDGIKLNYKLKVLTDEQVDEIHEATLKILEKTGIRFDSEECRKRIIRAGGVAHSTRKNVVTIPRDVVEDAIKGLHPYGEYYARDPKNDMVFDGEHQYSHCLGGNPNILDLETGETRMSTFEDVEKSTRIMDALPNCHSISNFVVATDVHPKLLVVKTMEAMMKNTSKCLSGYALNVESVDILWKMWTCIAGSEEELRKRPLFSVYGSPSSPLTYDEHAADVMIRGAEYG